MLGAVIGAFHHLFNTIFITFQHASIIACLQIRKLSLEKNAILREEYVANK